MGFDLLAKGKPGSQNKVKPPTLSSEFLQDQYALSG